MLSDAFVLAFLTTSGFLVIYNKLPAKIRKFLEKHSLFTDFTAAILTYLLFGGTLTALTASAMVGLMTSCLLYIAANPDDFTYLVDFKEALKSATSTLQQRLREYGRQYRENKLAKISG